MLFFRVFMCELGYFIRLFGLPVLGLLLGFVYLELLVLVLLNSSTFQHHDYKNDHTKAT